MWHTMQFATAPELIAWMIANGILVADAKFIYFDGASGRHVLIYFK